MKALERISGNSRDGIDVAVVTFGLEGGDHIARVLAHGIQPQSAELCERLVAALPSDVTTLVEVTSLDTRVGRVFATMRMPM